MKVFRNESGWDFDFSAAIRAIKSDSPERGVADGMLKAVDFIVEEDERILFIEVKSFVEAPFVWRNNNKCKYPNCEFEYALLPRLIRQCRDSWLFEWAAGADMDKRSLFVAFLAVTGTTPSYAALSADLKKAMPSSGVDALWKRRFIDDCIVVSETDWRKYFPQYPVAKSNEKENP